MGWYCRVDIESGIYLSEGVRYMADANRRLVPQPGPDSADFKQCAAIPSLFGWREEAEDEKPEPAAPAAPVAVEAPAEAPGAPAPPAPRVPKPKPAAPVAAEAPVEAPAPAAPKAPRKSKLIGG